MRVREAKSRSRLPGAARRIVLFLITIAPFPFAAAPLAAAPPTASLTTAPPAASLTTAAPAAAPPPLALRSAPGQGDDETAPRACTEHAPNRRAFFGDLHVHTALSSDAYVFAARSRPDDAYRFASGAGEARLQVITHSGLAQKDVRIPRPLDFAAVTDHAEMIGAPVVCTVPGNAGYASEVCQRFRAPFKGMGDLEEGVALIVALLRDLETPEVCGEDGARCAAGMKTAWEEIQESADRWNAPCDFTTFVAYEYSANPEMAKVHRNIIFKNATVPALPISSRAVPTVTGLWEKLAAECNDAGNGCDALTIPHNPNLSNGRVFALDYDGAEGVPAQRKVASLRARMEPLVEMFQIKGDSECRNGLAGVLGMPDAFCDFEKYRARPSTRFQDCGDGVGGGALIGKGCSTRRDFARYAIARGMAEEERLGVNPFKVGFIGSTDSHEGLPGDTAEASRDGIARPQMTNSFGASNPGGLAGVWAEENTRGALFDALRRRETFATSGPRMQIRLFGGWDLPEDLCSSPRLAETGYAKGVPMGGDLAAAPPPTLTTTPSSSSSSSPGTTDLPPTDRAATGPRFVTSALADPGIAGHPGGLLQRLQIIKVSTDAEGNAVQAVINVAGGANEASVDANTCTPQGSGASSLCGTWSDPDFDPAESAAYYARVIENPSCRSFARVCANADAGAFKVRPAACDDASLPRLAQERAWSAPIWYTPPR